MTAWGVVLDSLGMMQQLVARISSGTEDYTAKRHRGAPSLSTDDWDRMNAAARAQGDFWGKLLMGRGSRR